MFCPNCGNQLPEGANFCGNCGTAMPDTSQNTVLSFLKERFSNSNFTLAAVLLTVGTALTVLAGIFAVDFSIPVVQILIIIALWMIHSAVKTNKPLTAYVTPLKTARIAITIRRIITWIAVGVFAVVGLIFISTGIIAESFDVANIFDDAEFSYYSGSYTSELDMSSWGPTIIVIVGVVLIFAAVFAALLNIFMTGSWAKCVRSFEESAKSGTLMLSKVRAARGWIVFFGVTECISAFSVVSNVALGQIIYSMFSCLGTVCSAVALFLFAGVLNIEENLVDNF